jgi:hypothetical protein
VDAREGGQVLGLLSSWPSLELAAAASNGAGGGSTAARPGQEGGAPFMGGQGACKRPQGTTTTSMGARAGLGGSEQQGRQARNGPVVRRRSRPDGARREEGADSEAASVGAWPGDGQPRDAGGPRRRGTVRRARARRRRAEARATSRSGLKMFRTGPVQARFSPNI